MGNIIAHVVIYPHWSNHTGVYAGNIHLTDECFNAILAAPEDFIGEELAEDGVYLGQILQSMEINGLLTDFNPPFEIVGFAKGSGQNIQEIRQGYLAGLPEEELIELNKKNLTLHLKQTGCN